MILMAVFTFFQTAAFAETIKGAITKVDVAASDIYIHRTEINKNKDLPQDLQLKVGREAKLKNITSLADLKNGNEVNVKVKENKNLGIWEARSVELISQS